MLFLSSSSLLSNTVDVFDVGGVYINGLDPSVNIGRQMFQRWELLVPILRAGCVVCVL